MVQDRSKQIIAYLRKSLTPLSGPFYHCFLLYVVIAAYCMSIKCITITLREPVDAY